MTIIVIVFHFAFSGDRQCPFGIQRPCQVLPVPFSAAIAGINDIRREDLCRQGSQHAQGKCKGDEAAESRLLFHGNSLFLLVFSKYYFLWSSVDYAECAVFYGNLRADRVVRPYKETGRRIRICRRVTAKNPRRRGLVF